MRHVRWMLRSLWVAMPAVALLGVGVGAARAACSVDPCAGGGSAIFDCDRDGYTDAEECNGLSTSAGASIDFPSCRVNPSAAPACLDPAVSDLFVRLEKATNSAYTELGISDAAAFAFITQPVSAGGLAMRVHVLPAGSVLPSAPQPNAITPRMAALLVREVRGTPSACPITSPLGLINGSSSVNGAALAQVFTQRIIDHVGCVYASAGQSTTSAAATAHKIRMIQHTTAHEATHANRLAPASVDRYGGHHYKTGSGCVMDQASTYSTKGGKVSFSIPAVFCGPDQSAIAAGETALGAIQCEDADNVLDLDGFTIACLPATP